MKNEETRPAILQRVLYFVCELERCGDETFVSAMQDRMRSTQQARVEESSRTLLFSTN